MTLERYGPLISALIDGELTPAQRSEVLAHLRECAECSRLFNDYRNLRADLRALEALEPPPTLRQSLRRGTRPIGRPLGSLLNRAMAGLAALLLLAFGLTLPSVHQLAGLAPLPAELGGLLGRPPAAPTEAPSLALQSVETAAPAGADAPPTATAGPAPPTPTSPPLAVAPVPAPLLPTASVGPAPVGTTEAIPPPPSPSPLPTGVTTLPGRPAAVVPTTAAPASPTHTARSAAGPAATAAGPVAPLRPSPGPPTLPTPTLPAPATPPAAPASPPVVTASPLPFTATASPSRPPAAPTATANQPVVAAAFARVYESAAVRARLGRPIEVERGVDAVGQSFERGLMEGVGEGRQIYVLYGTTRTWAVFSDTWSASEPAATAEPAPPGLHRPRRGFGKVWSEHPSVRERLGWATAAEQSYAGLLQRFERGQLVRSTPLGSIIVLYEDGSWQRYDL